MHFSIGTYIGRSVNKFSDRQNLTSVLLSQEALLGMSLSNLQRMLITPLSLRTLLNAIREILQKLTQLPSDPPLPKVSSQKKTMPKVTCLERA